MLVIELKSGLVIKMNGGTKCVWYVCISAVEMCSTWGPDVTMLIVALAEHVLEKCFHSFILRTSEKASRLPLI